MGLTDPNGASVAMLAALLIACGADDPSSGSSTSQGGTLTVGGGGAGANDGGGTSAGGNGGNPGGGGSGGTYTDGVAMFLALGEGRRTIISCDGGNTWVADQVFEDNNSDHGPYSSRGLAYDSGTFVAALGWGNPGKNHTTTDAVTWSETFPHATQMSGNGQVGVAYGAGRFVSINNDDAYWSDDAGLTWQLGGEVPNTDNLRVVGYSDYGGGRFYVAGDANQIFVSSDGGLSWAPPTTINGSCVGNMSRRGGMAAGNDIFIIVTDTGNVCRTDDGGDTFDVLDISPGATGTVVNGNPVWTGTEFYVASHERGFTSSDALTWTEITYNLTNARIRRIAISDTGVFAGIARDGATFYRSDDGVSWTELGASAAPAGNDLTQIIFGYGTASAECMP